MRRFVHETRMRPCHVTLRGFYLHRPMTEERNYYVASVSILKIGKDFHTVESCKISLFIFLFDQGS
jgi:hypothetical protein